MQVDHSSGFRFRATTSSWIQARNRGTVEEGCGLSREGELEEGARLQKRGRSIAYTEPHSHLCQGQIGLRMPSVAAVNRYRISFFRSLSR